MSKLRSWGLLFVLLLFVLSSLGGCGGGTSNNGLNSSSPDEPITNDIAKIAEGTWGDTTGSGTATGQYTATLTLVSFEATLSDVQLDANGAGTVVVTGSQVWNIYDGDNLVLENETLTSTADTFNVTKTGTNSYRLTKGDRTLNVTLTSETEATIEETGERTVEGFGTYTYNTKVEVEKN